MVACVRKRAQSVCRTGILLGTLYHTFDLIFRKARSAFDPDLPLVASDYVFSRYVDDSVCINIKCDINLNQPASRRRDSNEAEYA